ncbi:MAG: 4'-phosphopantetheinyl transferase superfamily protein [Verrucomicrobiota bacterium]|nr:4'-phosphopantetheinyl transferase superfamily protein [Verrucomicrobiota bacterium]
MPDHLRSHPWWLRSSGGFRDRGVKSRGRGWLACSSRGHEYGGLPYVGSGDFVVPMLSEKTIMQLREEAQALAPTGATLEVAMIDQHTDEFLQEERQLVESWAPHRQREFARGRMCARRALDSLGVGVAGLLPDSDGIPQWPEGVFGSISHCRGVVMAIAANSADCRLIGLDLEKINRLSAGAISKVLHPIEESFAGSDQLKASILFSLKEAFYKAQFPKWRVVANFRDLALEVDLANDSAKIIEMDARFKLELLRLRFRFRVVDDYVVSLCWMPSFDVSAS